MPGIGKLKSFGAGPIISGALNSARGALDTSQQTVKGVRYNGVLWPLFIAPSEGPTESYEIDTCATSLGFSGARILSAVGNRDCTELCRRALATLVSLRKPDGSWPSIQLAPGVGAPAAMEGVVNDTIFALNALIDGGFLEKDHSSFQPAFSGELNELNRLANRIDWLAKSVIWIGENRLDRGWYFTSTEYMADKTQYSPVTAPTAAMVIVIDRLLRALIDEEKCAFRGVLETMKVGALAWLREIQHETGGFGRDAKDVPRIAHTSWALRALLLPASEEAEICAVRALDWLLMNARKKSLTRTSETDAFDQYGQAIFTDNHLYRKRLIAHEHPIEAVSLIAYCDACEARDRLALNSSRKGKLSKRIFQATKWLIERQAKDGVFRGAFESRRSIPAEKYPVYWIYFSVLGLEKTKKLLDASAISAPKNFLNGFLFRAAFVLAAIALYIAIKGFDINELAILLFLGVAVNVVSLMFTTD